MSWDVEEEEEGEEGVRVSRGKGSVFDGALLREAGGWVGDGVR